jgi:hypothetical protein
MKLLSECLWQQQDEGKSAEHAKKAAFSCALVKVKAMHQINFHGLTPLLFDVELTLRDDEATEKANEGKDKSAAAKQESAKEGGPSDPPSCPPLPSKGEKIQTTPRRSVRHTSIWKRLQPAVCSHLFMTLCAAASASAAAAAAASPTSASAADAAADAASPYGSRGDMGTRGVCVTRPNMAGSLNFTTCLPAPHCVLSWFMMSTGGGSIHYCWSSRPHPLRTRVHHKLVQSAIRLTHLVLFSQLTEYPADVSL